MYEQLKSRSGIEPVTDRSAGDCSADELTRRAILKKYFLKSVIKCEYHQQDEAGSKECLQE